jgi:hypothetical protein
MKVSIDIVYLVLAAFAVIGFITWLKNLYSSIKTKTWAAVGYSFLVLGSAILIAFAGGGEWSQIATTAFIVLALVELGYQIIVKTVLSMVTKLAGTDMSDAVSDALAAAANIVQGAQADNASATVTVDKTTPGGPVATATATADKTTPGETAPVANTVARTADSPPNWALVPVSEPPVEPPTVVSSPIQEYIPTPETMVATVHESDPSQPPAVPPALVNIDPAGFIKNQVPQ